MKQSVFALLKFVMGSKIVKMAVMSQFVQVSFAKRNWGAGNVRTSLCVKEKSMYAVIYILPTQQALLTHYVVVA